MVVHEGGSAGGLWVVISGELTVSRNDISVDTTGPGDFFGELAVIDPAPRNARELMVQLARRVREQDARPTAGQTRTDSEAGSRVSSRR